MWRYNSPIGPIYIKYIPSENRYGMIYDGTCWETCETPEAQADDVYMHVTGCHKWDRLDRKVSNAPRDLSEWEQI